MVRDAILRWYDANKRDLPWRRTRDPYAIWVSEVMLQQTTVATVIPYWERFLGRFPDVAALAAAPEEEVLRAWSGLGYYRRARDLRRAAAAVVAAGGAALPRSVEALRALPGIGPYTAAAIASIAHGAPVPVVDGNVERVLARLFAIDGDPKRGAARAEVARRAHDLLSADRPGDWNQALMELGATVCTPRAPLCAACPAAAACAAHARGAELSYPSAAPARATVGVLRGAAFVRGRDGRVLLARVRDGRPNAGLWELPAVTLAPAVAGRAVAGRAVAGRAVAEAEIAEAAAEALGAQLGLRLDGVEVFGRVRHAITHHRITTWLVTGRLVSARLDAGWTWIDEDAAAGEALTGEARKLFRLLAAGRRAGIRSDGPARPSARGPRTAPRPRR